MNVTQRLYEELCRAKAGERPEIVLYVKHPDCGHGEHFRKWDGWQWRCRMCNSETDRSRYRLKHAAQTA